MKLLKIEGRYVNPENISYIRPATTCPGTVLRMGGKVELWLSTVTPDEVAALVLSHETPLAAPVQNMVDLNRNTQALLSEANAKILELTDRLKLLASELNALKEIQV
jgi:hypothetical protein